MFSISKHTQVGDDRVILATDDMNELLKFFKWIETTQLFNVIKEETSRQGWNGVMPQLVSNEIQMQLKPGIPISRATDLPPELILQFYEKYPIKNEFKSVLAIDISAKERYDSPYLRYRDDGGTDGG